MRSQGCQRHSLRRRPARVHGVREAPERVIPEELPAARQALLASFLAGVGALGLPVKMRTGFAGALSPPQHPGALSAGRRGRGEHTQRRERGSPTQSHHRSPFLGGRSLHADAHVVTDTRTAKSLTHLLRAGHRWQRNVSSLRMSQPPSDWEVRGFSECRVRRISGSIWHFLCGLVAT